MSDHDPQPADSAAPELVQPSAEEAGGSAAAGLDDAQDGAQDGANLLTFLARLGRFGMTAGASPLLRGPASRGARAAG